ncbi:MAG TPA: class I SAM-dependent methyltransferase [Thermoanaerobaculia bacterium]|nr:class I SAM-dependent methyltransferase [Thermoanaerobaculia bacterium]
MPTPTEALVRDVVKRYPSSLRDGQASLARRFAFEIDLTFERAGTPTPRVCDVGGGWGTFALGCAARGARATLVDDYGDSGFGNEEDLAAMSRLLRELGVETVARDVVRDGLGFPEGSFDVVTSFESIEHWHHSTKRALASMLGALVPGGAIIVSAPNCVNLRKRLSAPLGRAKWSSMHDWYEQDVFRGHVREPDVDDLRYIARDLGLQQVEILGRNWFGYYNDSRLVRRLTPLADRLLRLRPSLCANLYLVGRKPERG